MVEGAGVNRGDDRVFTTFQKLDKTKQGLGNVVFPALQSSSQPSASAAGELHANASTGKFMLVEGDVTGNGSADFQIGVLGSMQ